MILTDVHVHSACSQDAETPMREMALAAREAGVAFLCFTDHSDVDDEWGGVSRADIFEKARRLADFAEAKEAVGESVELRFGVELGGAHHAPEAAAAVASAPELDFIIASVHQLRGQMDFYHGMSQGMYTDAARCEALLAQYVQEHLEMARESEFDVIGHIGYPLRYMARCGFAPDILAQEEALRALFRLLVERGKGIEVNTSGLRQGMGTTLPRREVLALYRECGGDLITLGSDAHRPADIAADMAQARELLRALGFRWHAVFRNRKADFLPLE